MYISYFYKKLHFMRNTTKFGSPKLDLYNSTYDFPKLHANLAVNGLSFYSTAADSTGPRNRRARVSAKEKQRSGAARRGSARVHRRRASLTRAPVLRESPLHPAPIELPS